MPNWSSICKWKTLKEVNNLDIEMVSRKNCGLWGNQLAIDLVMIIKTPESYWDIWGLRLDMLILPKLNGPIITLTLGTKWFEGMHVFAYTTFFIGGVVPIFQQNVSYCKK